MVLGVVMDTVHILHVFFHAFSQISAHLEFKNRPSSRVFCDSCCSVCDGLTGTGCCSQGDADMKPDMQRQQLRDVIMKRQKLKEEKERSLRGAAWGQDDPSTPLAAAFPHGESVRERAELAQGWGASRGVDSEIVLFSTPFTK